MKMFISAVAATLFATLAFGSPLPYHKLGPNFYNDMVDECRALRHQLLKGHYEPILGDGHVTYSRQLPAYCDHVGVALSTPAEPLTNPMTDLDVTKETALLFHDILGGNVAAPLEVNGTALIECRRRCDILPWWMSGWSPHGISPPNGDMYGDFPHLAEAEHKHRDGSANEQDLSIAERRRLGMYCLRYSHQCGHGKEWRLSGGPSSVLVHDYEHSNFTLADVKWFYPGTHLGPDVAREPLVAPMTGWPGFPYTDS